MAHRRDRSRPTGKSGRVTIHTVAEMAGVSAATVSRVLNDSDLVKTSTREKVLEVLEESGFKHPSRVARALRTRRTGLIGLLVADILNPYYAVVAREMEDAGKEAGMTMLLSNDDGEEDVSVERLQLFGSLNVDGVFVSTWIGNGPTRDAMRQLRNQGVCVLSIGDMIDEKEFDVVAVDYYSAAREAVRRLLDLGHRRIGFIGIAPGDNRARGYRDEMVHAGLSANNLTLPSVVSPRRLHDLMPLHLPQFVKERRLTAIIAHNDVYALEVIRIAQSMGCSVPGELSVIGFDNVPQGDASMPRLSTVAPPFPEMIREAMEIVRRRLEGDADPVQVRTVLSARLILRQSVDSAP